MSGPLASRPRLLAAGVAAAGLAGGGAAAAGAAAAPPAPGGLPGALPEADRRLLGLRRLAERQVAAYAGAVREGWAAEAAGDRAAKAAADAEADRHWDEYKQAIDEMAALPAEGLAGLAAKVAGMALFAEHLRSGINNGEADLVESASADAARQLVALDAPDALATLGRPDDALLAACDRWEDARAELEELHAEAGLTPLDAVAWARSHILQAQASAALDDVIGLRAFTLSGRQAKAGILIAQIAGRDEPLARLATSVCWDAMGHRA